MYNNDYYTTALKVNRPCEHKFTKKRTKDVKGDKYGVFCSVTRGMVEPLLERYTKIQVQFTSSPQENLQ